MRFSTVYPPVILEDTWTETLSTGVTKPCYKCAQHTVHKIWRVTDKNHDLVWTESVCFGYIPQTDPYEDSSELEEDDLFCLTTEFLSGRNPLIEGWAFVEQMNTNPVYVKQIHIDRNPIYESRGQIYDTVHEALAVNSWEIPMHFPLMPVIYER